MTRTEFAKGVLYLSAGIGQDMDIARVDVFFDLLGDLDYDTFIAACRVVLLRHVWATFPSAAELREAAITIIRGATISPAEAWQLAWEAAKGIDPDMTGPHRVYEGDGKFKEYPSQAAAIMDNLPKSVAIAVRAFGLRELCLSDEPVGVVRGQFMKMYEQIAESDKRREMLPPSVREPIEAKQIPKAAIEQQRDAQQLLATIGEMQRTA